MNEPPKIVGFPNTEEERARRLRAEVERLATLPPVEWMFYLDGVASKHDIEAIVLKRMIEATIKEREKKAAKDKAEDRQREQRAEKEQTKARREQRQADKETERARKEANGSSASRRRGGKSVMRYSLRLPRFRS
jgi:hypothetical protein